MSELKSSLAETMQKIEVVLNQNPEPILNMNVLYQFDITGAEEGTYQLKIEGGEAKIIKGSVNEAECTLKMSLESFQKFLAGMLKGTVAFMTGKLKINGDMTKALKLETILKQYNLD